MLCFSALTEAMLTHACRGTRRTFGRRRIRTGVLGVETIQSLPSQPDHTKLVGTGFGESHTGEPQWARKLPAHRQQRRIGTREDEQQCCRGPPQRSASACQSRPLGRGGRSLAGGVCAGRRQDNYQVVVGSWTASLTAVVHPHHSLAGCTTTLATARIIPVRRPCTRIPPPRCIVSNTCYIVAFPTVQSIMLSFRLPIRPFAGC